MKFFLIYGLFLLPTAVFSSTCSPRKLTNLLMNEQSSIVSFKVMENQLATQTSKAFIDIEITKEFLAHKITTPYLRIETENGFDIPSFSSFTQNIEWLTVLSPYKNTYIIAACAPALVIKNQKIIGSTGIESLQHLEGDLSIELFDIALKAYHQGIKSADNVCKSNNTYCTGQASYDVKTGILNLPSVRYTSFRYSSFLGITAYAQVQMQKMADEPQTFIITDLK